LIPDGVDENSLQIAYYDSAANVWVPLPSTIDINNKFITAPISHFSTYAVTYGVKMPAPVQTTTTTPVIVTTPLLITTPTTMPVATTTAASTTTAPVTTSTTTTAPAQITATTQTAAVTGTNVAPLSANSSINTLPEQTTSRLQTSPSPASKATAPVWLFVIIGIAVLVGCLIITLLVSRRRG
jgi:cobalamin biosynthesis Mg chelatase CobN